MSAERISQWSSMLGGDGHLALYYTPGREWAWEATTTVDRPRARGRYLSAKGRSPDEALQRLWRTMPAVPDSLRVIR